jgi:type VI secretion system protein VasI
MKPTTSKQRWGSSLAAFAFALGILAGIVASHRALADSWQSQREVSAMDDSPTVALWTSSTNAVANGLGLETVSPDLVIVCKENKTSLYVDWKMYITTGGLDNDQPVRYRVDEDTAKTESWDMSTNFEATGLWSGGRSIPLIKRLVTAKLMIVETTPYGRNTERVSFDVEGLADHIDEIKKACHWN